MNNQKLISMNCPNLESYLRNDAALMLVLLTPEGTIIDANRYARDIVGQDITGKALSSIIVDFSNTFSLEQTLQKSESSHLFNVSSYTGLPQTFYFRFIRQGENILAIGELNHLEVEDLRKNLTSLNNEFSNLNRELHKKNAELVKLNDLKNHFLGMAAHDLRNPIGAIQNLSEFLLEETGDKLSPEHMQFLNVIHNSSKFMLNLLDQLLDIARIEAGKLDLDIRPTDIIDLIKSCVYLNKIIADKKNVEVLFHHYESFPDIELDAMKIEQVMHNLLSNAIKFSDPGSTVFVSVFLTNGHVTVSVRDEGPGIPRKDIEKLYKPFSKTSVKLPEGEKSTGLGLAIVHKIILGHLGKIWVESKVGEGSTFFFSLPVKSLVKK